MIHRARQSRAIGTNNWRARISAVDAGWHDTSRLPHGVHDHRRGLRTDSQAVLRPAAHRLAFGRFLTADVAAIQIQKGYASVLDGPGAMGGAINLVTTKPTRAFEAEGGIDPRAPRCSERSTDAVAIQRWHRRSSLPRLGPRWRSVTRGRRPATMSQRPTRCSLTTKMRY